MSDSKQPTNPSTPMTIQTDAPTPSAVDVEREALPDTAPDTESDVNTKPPLPFGASTRNDEAPVETAQTNPTHHTGRVPPNVTGEAFKENE